MVRAVGSAAQSSSPPRAEVTFRIAALAGWTPDTEPVSAPAGVPSSLRRRVTPIGRKVLEAAWSVLPQAGEAPRLVLSSRHGEYARTMGLLNSLVDEGQVSPAEFSLAVHHALVGLLSIASGNHAGHTAIAAGSESFGYGLLEAAVCAAADGRPVVLMHFDEDLPAEYATIEPAGEAAVAVALVVAPIKHDGGVAVAMSLAPGAAAGGQGLAASFLEFLHSSQSSAECAGERSNWLWRRV